MTNNTLYSVFAEWGSYSDWRGIILLTTNTSEEAKLALRWLRGMAKASEILKSRNQARLNGLLPLKFSTDRGSFYVDQEVEFSMIEVSPGMAPWSVSPDRSFHPVLQEPRCPWGTATRELYEEHGSSCTLHEIEEMARKARTSAC